ncbi:MAG: iron-sulfur cluster carrier protein MrpORP [Desulfobacteraceae bacterium]|jgi:Mrp family chromosome partitioning ATPase/predicted Fe-Mo cluster-binding NifX family protein
MGNTDRSCGLSQKDKHDIQDAEIGERLKHIKNKILVMSGKGGVGKSSVAAYLAVALAKRGYTVGLMDVDLHGPSIPRLLGLKGSIQPSLHPGKALPINFLPNMQVMSIEVLLGENKDAATIWRGPLKIGVIRQFISDIDWSDLEYLVIDSPPGTGDEPLTVAQTIPDAKALVITTPQEISLADVRKSISFCRQVNMQILGVVENMSGLQCPHCGKEIELFKSRGGLSVAEKEGLKLLASLPIDPEVVRQGDMGSVAMLDDEQLPFTRAFNKMVDQIVKLSHTEPQVLVKEKEDKEVVMEKIKFAVPVSGGKLCSHFGHCDQFALIETEDGRIRDKSMHTPPPHEPGVLPRWLHEMGANIIIAGGMGSRAQDLFNQNGIKVITGAPMDSPESLVNQYLADILVTGENVCDH